MRHRHAITVDGWKRIKDLLPGQPADPSVTAKDNKLGSSMRSSESARPRPPGGICRSASATGTTSVKRFYRWVQKGIWQRLFEALPDPDLEWHGSSWTRPWCGRTSMPPGCEKTGGAEAEALGRSRGGFGTKIHAAVNGLGLPVKLVRTPGQAAAVTQAKTFLEGVPLEVAVGDKDFDSQGLVNFIEVQGGEAVIPSRTNRTQPPDYDREWYKNRNLVERFWNKIKHYRRVATRYEKTVCNFLAFIPVASIMLLLQ